MDAYDCEKIDKAISKRLNAIYSDPKRHAFCSDYQVSVDQDWRGPRGGKIKGYKRICHYCGYPERGHAEVTDKLD